MKNDVRKCLKEFIPHVIRARTENLMEADTVALVAKIFEEVLGYDPLSEITHECQLKNKYVDIAIKLDGGLKLLVEIKAAGKPLRDRHVEQAQDYAARAGVPWVLLTNAVDWWLYHLSIEEGEPIEYDKAFAVDLSAEQPIDGAAERLSIMHRQSLTKGGLEDYWRERSALSAGSIAEALFTHEALRVIRTEIHHKHEILIDEEDLAHAIHEMFSNETQVSIGPVKIKHKIHRKRKTERATDGAPQDPPDANGEGP